MFSTVRARERAALAQSAEHLTRNEKVKGSIPLGGSIRVFHRRVEHPHREKRQTMAPGPLAYFTKHEEGLYRATEHAESAWGDAGLHFSPVAGLLVHHLERWRARHADPTKQVGRISFDILGHIANEDIRIETRLVRPGRTIELLETTAIIEDRPAISARSWVLSTVDTGRVAGGQAEPFPAPEGLPARNISSIWPGGYIRSLDARQVGDARPGRASAWFSTDCDLVAGEEASSLASYLALVDTANGVAARQRPEEWLFPNLDLTVHLFRQPEGRWVGVDTTAIFGPTGQGLTSTILHDVHGQVGTAQQLLTLRPAPVRAD